VSGRPVHVPADAEIKGSAQSLSIPRKVSNTPRKVSCGPEAIARAPQPLRLIEPSAPEGLDQIVTKCLQPDPACRYFSSAELLADLEQLDAGGRLTATQLPAGTPRLAAAAPTTRLGRALRRPRALAGVVVALAVTAAAVAAGARRIGIATPSAPRAGVGLNSVTLAVLPFRNASGDASLDWLGDSLAEMLADDMRRVPAFHVVANERVFRLLSDLRISPPALDRPTIARIGDLSNAKIVVSGEYIKIGGQALRFEATVHDFGRQHDSRLTAQARDPNAIVDSAQQLASSLLKQFEGIDYGGTSPLVPSSRSPQAIREYNLGLQFARESPARR
jgi:TolB-like protein